MPIDLIINTLTLASEYNLDPLVFKLEHMLALNITKENVCSLLMLADAHNANAKVSALYTCVYSF